jgi:hypothetical protein
MGEESALGSQDGSAKNAIDAFLHQPALHADEDVQRPEAPRAPAVHVGWRRALINFMFYKKPSGYSSLVPRDSQGRRSKPFFFNGNGRGR